MSSFLRAGVVFAPPLLAVALSKLLKNFVDCPTAYPRNSLWCGRLMKVSSSLHPRNGNCIENNLKMYRLDRCSAGREFSSSIELHLCGGKGSKPEALSYPVKKGPKTMSHAAYMVEVDKYFWRRRKYEKARKNMLEPRFGDKYTTLFDIEDIEWWMSAMNEMFREASLKPQDSDPLPQQLKITGEARETIDQLSELYGYMPGGDLRKHVLKVMKGRSVDLRSHEEELKRQYERGLKKIASE